MKSAFEWLQGKQVASFLVLGTVFLGAAIVAAFHSVSFGWPSVLNWSATEAATASAGFATVAVIFFGLQQFASQRLAERSKFAMDMAMDAVRQADQVIEKDTPTRNMAWVNAARLILRSLDMSKSITLLDHRVAWELFREEWRIKLLGRLFACPDYFCGVGEWQPQPDQVVIDDEFATRIAASAHREVAFNAPNVSATYFGETLVNENAIRIIFEFTEYGADWKDPIRDRSGFGKNLSDVMYQRNMYGLWGYVELRRKYHLGMGSARRRKANDVGHEDRASDDYIGT